MQVIVPHKSAPLAHPIELMEKFVAANDWRLHHASATEISVEMPGQWSDYTLNLTWQDKFSALHLNVFSIFSSSTARSMLPAGCHQHEQPDLDGSFRPDRRRWLSGVSP